MREMDEGKLDFRSFPYLLIPRGRVYNGSVRGREGGTKAI